MTNTHRGETLVKVDGENYWFRPVGDYRTLISNSRGSQHTIENHLVRAPADTRARHMSEDEVIGWIKSLHELPMVAQHLKARF